MNSVKVAVLVVVVILGWYTVVALAISPTSEEMTLAKEWVVANLGPETKALPFYFRYDGKRRGARWSKGLLEKWQIERSSQKLDEHRTQTTITYTDPKTSLEVRCVLVEYNDFPTVEWTVYFKNNGTVDTPFLDDIQGLYIDLNRGPAGEFLLHHNVGSPANSSDYGLLETPLPKATWKRFNIKGGGSGIAGGRGTSSDWPYYNLEWDGGRQGMIIVVGWPGQWATQFKRNERTGLRVVAGQEWTHLKLHPGEEIRTPLIVLQFWEGDWIRAQNIWRRWMIKHNLPRPGGKLPAPMFSVSITGYGFCMYGSDEKKNKMYIDHYLEKGLNPDCYWMDTGWFVDNWEPDPKRFPNGIRAISDYAHAKGLKTILWFEPERITKKRKWILSNHPDWCLPASTHPDHLLNLGNPDALEWITNCVHKRLTEADIDIFRSDFNMGPLNHWRHNDSKDRQGILENHFVKGYLAFWDELLRRNPNLLIDSCASGGKRNDLETMRRSIILHRTDRSRHHDDGLGMQCQTYGISLWLPYHGVGAGGVISKKNSTPYFFRSCMYPAVKVKYHYEKDYDYDLIRRMFSQWRQINKYYFGDYYPLTPYSMANDVWMAWQFDQPDLGEGMVQAFRRPESMNDSFTFKLRGLEPAAKYELSDGVTSENTVSTGRELGEEGLKVHLAHQPDSIIITYRKIN